MKDSVAFVLFPFASLALGEANYYVLRISKKPQRKSSCDKEIDFLPIARSNLQAIYVSHLGSKFSNLSSVLEMSTVLVTH